MQKPKPHRYYDYQNVIRYLVKKHNLPDSIEDDFFNWMVKHNDDLRQDSLIDLYLDDASLFHECCNCSEYCEYHTTPNNIRDVLVLMREFDKEAITLHVWW